MYLKILLDLKAFVDGEGKKKMIATVLFNPCFHSVFLYRVSNFFYKIKLNVIAKMIWYLNRIIFNVDIDYRANLAGGFVLVHGLGVVIGKDVFSKGILKVYQGVTIGGNNFKFTVDENGEKFWQPRIGENVIIFTNASLFGPIKIKANTIIKSGQIISKDIE